LIWIIGVLPSEAEELGSNPKSHLPAGTGFGDLLALGGGSSCLGQMA